MAIKLRSCLKVCSRIIKNFGPKDNKTKTIEYDSQNLPDFIEIDSEGNDCIDEFCLVTTF